MGKGICAGVYGKLPQLHIATSGSGLAVREFVRGEIQTALQDNRIPLEDVLNRSGIVLASADEATILSYLITTPGGTYLRDDKERKCLVMPDGIRYSDSSATELVMVELKLGDEKIKQLAAILSEEGLDNVRNSVPNQNIAHIRKALEFFVKYQTT